MNKIMCGYLAMYKGKEFEIYTEKGIYQAQLIAMEHFKTKKGWEISINLCEKDGKEVIHTADF